MGQDVSSSVTYNLTISYCWFHDAGRVLVQAIPRSGTIIEYSVFERNGQATIAMKWNPSEHSEAINWVQVPGTAMSDPLIFRFNVVRDWRSTGGLIIAANTAAMTVYGNVFATTGYWAAPSEANDSNGALSGNSNYSGMTVRVYNNTFVDIAYGGQVLTQGGFAFADVRNNLFYNVHNCKAVSGVCTSAGAAVNSNRAYNWYFAAGAQVEANMESGVGDPFVNRLGRDYRLAAPTSAGDISIGSAYNADSVGVVRGADGTWDRGAFEYPSGNTSGPVRPGAPGNLRVVHCQGSGGCTN
jgi:hypothetical protein